MSDETSTPPSGSAQGNNGSWRPQEGRDYYFNEQGLMVMTAAYHLRRGYCCGSGCKHCPYPKKGLNS